MAASPPQEQPSPDEKITQLESEDDTVERNSHPGSKEPADTLATPIPPQTEDVPKTVNDPPPNGGVLAWLQVAGCFALYLNTL